MPVVGAPSVPQNGSADTIVGERSMGDARYDYQELTYGFFDRFLKGLMIDEKGQGATPNLH